MINESEWFWDGHKIVDEIKETKDDIKRIKRGFNFMSRVADLQEKVIFSFPSINESLAISQNLARNANCLIAEVSKWKGDTRKLVEYNYLANKIGEIVNDYNAMAHNYNIANYGKAPLMVLKKEDEELETPPKEMIESQRKEIWKKQDEINKTIEV